MKTQVLCLWALALFFILPACKPSYTYVAKVDNSSVGVAAAVGIDSAFEAVIQPYRQELGDEMNEVIGNASVDLPRGKEQLESSLAKFVTDLMLHQARKKTEADLALVTTGGLRVGIPKGPITVGLIFELMPFENELVVVNIKGSELAKLFDLFNEKEGIPLANAKVTIRRGKAVSVYIGGEKLDPNRSYRLVTSDYLATGGDNLSFLADKPTDYLGVKVRETIMGHIRELTEEGKKVEAPSDQRIVVEE